MTIAPPTVPPGLNLCGSPTLEGFAGNLTKRPWCVYEHWLHDPDAPDGRTLIFVSACKLTDVFTLIDGKANSEWNRLVTDRSYLFIRIVFTGERVACQREAANHARRQSPYPRCNLAGFNMHGANRPILCSNGVTYSGQTEAAQALGLNQGQISLHLRGQVATVKGYTFTYAMDAANG